MSTSIEINGVNLVSIKEATSLVSYSKDYIARLAREGKIVASQVGRQWFVDTASLQNYSEASALEEAVRKTELSAERKRELSAKERLNSLESLSGSKIKSHRTDALIVSAATLCLGLVTGFGFYTAALFGLPGVSKISSSLAVVSSSLSLDFDKKVSVDTSVSLPVPQDKQTMMFSTVTEFPVFETESETKVLSEDSAGILVFAKAGGVKDSSSVEALFSDVVEATFTDDNSGVVRYESGDGVAKEFPFVTVPSREPAPASVAVVGESEVMIKRQ